MVKAERGQASTQKRHAAQEANGAQTNTGDNPPPTPNPCLIHFEMLPSLFASLGLCFHIFGEDQKTKRTARSELFPNGLQDGGVRTPSGLHSFHSPQPTANIPQGCLAPAGLPTQDQMSLLSSSRAGDPTTRPQRTEQGAECYPPGLP